MYRTVGAHSGGFILRGRVDSDLAVCLHDPQVRRRGFVMNVTNPKLSIFFLAFLPQFADPTRGSLVFQLLVSGGAFMLATILVFGSIAMSASFAGEWFSQSPKAQRVMSAMAGTVLASLAVKLASTRQLSVGA